MWAAVVSVEIEDGDKSAQMLKEQVIPGVKAAPGFISGVWVNVDKHHGTSIVVFDTEENARATMPAEGPGPMPGVTITSAKVGQVVGQA
jgi:hypothetical protein